MDRDDPRNPSDYFCLLTVHQMMKARYSIRGIQNARFQDQFSCILWLI